MFDSPSQAVVFLIDNSATSLDGDFHPNRLDAQKNAVQRLVTYFVSSCRTTQIGLGTMGSTAFGIVSCLTTNAQRFSQCLDRISRGGECCLDRAIRCAILSLKMRDQAVVTQRVIALISSLTPLTPEDVIDLSRIAHRDRVSVDIVAFGDDVDHNALQHLVSRMPPNSHFVFCPAGGLVLSDAVCASEIGPGLEEGRHLALDDEDDPDLAAAIKTSLASREEGELAQVLAQSRKDGFSADEVQLMSAIQASMEEPRKPNREDEEHEEHKDEDQPDPEGQK
jgi:26S proteasome regulatory subunit N10